MDELSRKVGAPGEILHNLGRKPAWWHYPVGVALITAAAGLSYTSGLVFMAGAGCLLVLSLLLTRALFKKLQEVELESKKAAEDLCRVQNISAIDELSGGIAHELNNPLAIIAQELQWLQHVFGSQSLQGIKEVDDCADSIAEIDRQVHRCKEIIQKLLGLARDAKPVYQLIDVNDLVAQMSVLIEREAADKKITVYKSLQEGLPEILSDPPLLRQVILNLLTNAVYAVDQHGSIHLSTRAADDVVEITIQDTGCGIPTENLNKIFSPFFSTKPEGKGTGLGLALCRGIIERLGGRITAESLVGECTTFTVYLPLDRKPE
jgi:two-component system NtrC family sensor kinase